jgi:hypothetical protein
MLTQSTEHMTRHSVTNILYQILLKVLYSLETTMEESNIITELLDHRFSSKSYTFHNWVTMNEHHDTKYETQILLKVLYFL